MLAESLIVSGGVCVIQNLPDALTKYRFILLSILLRRVDDVLWYFGIDFLGPATPVILSWIATTVLFVAFLKVWIRRNEIAHIVSRLKTSQRYTDAIQGGDETLQRFR